MKKLRDDAFLTWTHDTANPANKLRNNELIFHHFLFTNKRN